MAHINNVSNGMYQNDILWQSIGSHQLFGHPYSSHILLLCQMDYFDFLMQSPSEDIFEDMFVFCAVL